VAVVAREKFCNALARKDRVWAHTFSAAQPEPRHKLHFSDKLQVNLTDNRNLPDVFQVLDSEDRPKIV
jgi:hypothetical protein